MFWYSLIYIVFNHMRIYIFDNNFHTNVIVNQCFGISGIISMFYKHILCFEKRINAV